MNPLDKLNQQDELNLLDRASTTKNTYLSNLYILMVVQYSLATLFQLFAIKYPYYLNWVTNHTGVATVNAIQLLLILIIVYIFKAQFKFSQANWIIYAYFSFLLSYEFIYVTDGGLVLAITTQLALLFLSLGRYAQISRKELNLLGSTVYIMGACYTCYGLFLMLSRVEFTHLLFLSLLSMILGFYLVYDSRNIAFNLSETHTEDPLIGAIVIYINELLLVLRLLNKLSKIFKKNRFHQRS